MLQSSQRELQGIINLLFTFLDFVSDGEAGHILSGVVDEADLLLRRWAISCPHLISHKSQCGSLPELNPNHLQTLGLMRPWELHSCSLQVGGQGPEMACVQLNDRELVWTDLGGWPLRAVCATLCWEIATSSCSNDQWGLEGLHSTGHPLSCFVTALVEIHVTGHYSEHGVSPEMETQGLKVRLTRETRHLRNSGHVVILSWLAALDCQAWKKGKMSHKSLALPILSTSLPRGHPRLWVYGKDDKCIQVGLAVSVI